MNSYEIATAQILEKPETETLIRPESIDVNFIREVSVNYRGQRRKKVFIGCAAHAVAFTRSVLPDNSREHFVTLYLDGAHKIAAFSVTATGTADSCPERPRTRPRKLS